MELSKTEPITVSVERAGQILSLGKTSIYNLISLRKLERCSILGRTLITTASIRNLVEASTVIEDTD